MKPDLKTRDSALDLLRIAAAFFVISVHSVGKAGFYDLPMVGMQMYLMTVIRQFFMCCVALFMLLTGYLMSRKKLSARYYRGIIHTLLIYVLASTVTMLYRVHIGEDFSPKMFVLGLLDFSGAPYAWYVEMYVGLFLLIPFLNLIYWNLENKKQKQWLIATLMIVCCTSSLLNNFNFTQERWWAKLLTTDGWTKISPDFWRTAYPLVYYFTGCYLREYQPKFRASRLLAALAVHLGLYAALMFFKSGGEVFPWQWFSDNSSPLNWLTAVLVFLLIKNIDTSRWTSGVKRALQYLAGLSLGTYLVSWVPDQILPELLLDSIPDPHQKLWGFLILAPAVFLSASLLSAAVDLAAKLLTRTGEKLCSLRRKN